MTRTAFALLMVIHSSSFAATKVTRWMEWKCEPNTPPAVGYPATKQRVFLRYVKNPHYYEELFSDALAEHLAKQKKTPVPVELELKEGSYSIVQVAGLPLPPGTSGGGGSGCGQVDSRLAPCQPTKKSNHGPNPRALEPGE